MDKTEFINKLMNFPTEMLRDINGEIIKDAIICIKDNVPFHCWTEDIREDPDAYSYDDYELETFLFHIGPIN